MTNLSNIARLELLKAAVDRAHAEQVAATGNLTLGITNRKLHDAFNEYAAFHAVCFDEKGRPRDQLIEAASFRPELHINGEGWVANGLRFASPAEAIACARDPATSLDAGLSRRTRARPAPWTPPPTSGATAKQNGSDRIRAALTAPLRRALRNSGAGKEVQMQV